MILGQEPVWLAWGWPLWSGQECDSLGGAVWSQTHVLHQWWQGWLQEVWNQDQDRNPYAQNVGDGGRVIEEILLELMSSYSRKSWPSMVLTWQFGLMSTAMRGCCQWWTGLWCPAPSLSSPTLTPRLQSTSPLAQLAAGRRWTPSSRILLSGQLSG